MLVVAGLPAQARDAPGRSPTTVPPAVHRRGGHDARRRRYAEGPAKRDTTGYVRDPVDPLRHLARHHRDGLPDGARLQRGRLVCRSRNCPTLGRRIRCLAARGSYLGHYPGACFTAQPPRLRRLAAPRASHPSLSSPLKPATHEHGGAGSARATPRCQACDCPRYCEGEKRGICSCGHGDHAHGHDDNAIRGTRRRLRPGRRTKRALVIASPFFALLLMAAAAFVAASPSDGPCGVPAECLFEAPATQAYLVLYLGSLPTLVVSLLIFFATAKSVRQ